MTSTDPTRHYCTLHPDSTDPAAATAGRAALINAVADAQTRGLTDFSAAVASVLLDVSYQVAGLRNDFDALPARVAASNPTDVSHLTIVAELYEDGVLIARWLDVPGWGPPNMADALDSMRARGWVIHDFRARVQGMPNPSAAPADLAAGGTESK